MYIYSIKYDYTLCPDFLPWYILPPLKVYLVYYKWFLDKSHTKLAQESREFDVDTNGDCIEHEQLHKGRTRIRVMYHTNCVRTINKWVTIFILQSYIQQKWLSLCRNKSFIFCKLCTTQLSVRYHKQQGLLSCTCFLYMFWAICRKQNA